MGENKVYGNYYKLEYDISYIIGLITILRSELQMEHKSTYIYTQPKYDVVEWVIKRRSNHT